MNLKNLKSKFRELIDEIEETGDVMGGPRRAKELVLDLEVFEDYLEEEDIDEIADKLIEALRDVKRELSYVIERCENTIRLIDDFARLL